MSVTLNDTQLDDVLAALEDAAEYRSMDADCARCGDLICPDCKADWIKRIRYTSLELSLRKAAGHD